MLADPLVWDVPRRHAEQRNPLLSMHNSQGLLILLFKKKMRAFAIFLFWIPSHLYRGCGCKAPIAMCVSLVGSLVFFVFFRNSFFFFFFCLFSLSSHALCTWTSFGATSRSPIYCLHVTEFVRNTAKGRQQWFARVQEVALKASAEPQIFISAFEAFLKIFCIAQKHLHFPQFFSALNATCFRQWEKKKKERSPQKFVFNIPPNVWFIFPSSALKFFAPFGTKYMHRNTFSCFCTV